MVEDFRQLCSEETGDDGGRCFVTTQTVGIGGAGDAGLEQAVVTPYGHECLYDKGYEPQVVLLCAPWTVEQDAGVGHEAPVVVLARTVDAGERLLVEQAAEAVVARHLFHEHHQQHVVVYREVRLLEDRGKLKLVGRSLIVACLAGDAQFESLNLKVAHEGCHTFGDRAEVVVVHLLVLG